MSPDRQSTSDRPDGGWVTARRPGPLWRVRALSGCFIPVNRTDIKSDSAGRTGCRVSINDATVAWQVVLIENESPGGLDEQ
jgi:hypothetical protein